MFNRKLTTLSTLLLLMAGLVAGRPCVAADFSSTSSGGLSSVRQTMHGLEIKLESVKSNLVRELMTLQSIESRIIAGKDLDTVPRDLDLSSKRIDVMQDELAKIAKSATTIGVRLMRIRDDARRRGDDQLAAAAERALGQLAQLKTEINVIADGVASARDTVTRLREMLG
jgi:hypothetical protein